MTMILTLVEKITTKPFECRKNIHATVFQRVSLFILLTMHDGGHGGGAQRTNTSDIQLFMILILHADVGISEAEV